MSQTIIIRPWLSNLFSRRETAHFSSQVLVCSAAESLPLPLSCRQVSKLGAHTNQEASDQEPDIRQNTN